MGGDLAVEFEAAVQIYRRAGEILGWHVADLSFHGPDDRLNLTEFAQVALYVNSAAAMAVLAESGIHGDVVSGHSLGEYSALAASGAISFEEGLRLVAQRGEVMAQAARRHPGAMAAVIGLDDGQVEEITARVGRVWPVNYNCPGQLVISGETEAVEAAMAAATEAGARKVVRLAVSGSFHSPLMQEAAEAMRITLAEVRFAEPAPPFLSSISCEYEKAAGLADLLVRQIVSPVRWRQTVERLISDGVDRFLEVGNGKVLSGLIRRIDRDVAIANVSDPASLEKALALARA
jgi:[acyl-carrier-protein] S-malonyltransferase